MDANTRKILENLEPYGLGANKDIASILEEMFRWDGSLNDLALMEHAKGMVRFLDEIENAGLIKLYGKQHHEYGRGNINEGFQWFGRTPIGAAITLQGMSALAMERAKEATSEVDKSVLTTNASIQQLNETTSKSIKSQKTLTILALIIAAVSAIGTVSGFMVNLLKPDKKLQVSIPEIQKLKTELKPEIDSLYKNLERLDSTVKSLKIQQNIKH